MRNRNEDLAKLSNAFFDNLTIVRMEYGGVGLDPKRPFGNSDVEADILEIIGWEPQGDDGYGECYASAQREYASLLYEEYLIPHLQIKWMSKDDFDRSLSTLGTVGIDDGTEASGGKE